MSVYDRVCDRGNLTRRQLLIWAGDRVANGAPVFVEAVRWHLHGPLDPLRLVRAFDAVVRGADALCSSIEEVDGWPSHAADRRPLPTLAVVDLARHGAPARTLEDLTCERVAACGASGGLVEAVLVRLASERHVLVLVLHQLVADAWSVRLLHARLVAHYRVAEGQVAASARRRFADWVAYERAYRASARAEEAQRYWERCHAGVASRPDVAEGAPPDRALRVHRLVVPFGARRCAAFRRLAGARASLDLGSFVIVASAVAAHVHRTTGAADLLFDVPFANRPAARFKDTIGSFMNVCPMRFGVTAGDRFGDVADRLMEATWEAARHQTYAGRAAGVPQPYDVLVNVQRAEVAAATFDACALRVEWVAPTHRFGAAAIALHDFGATGDMTLVLDLNEATFPVASQTAFAASLLRALDEQLADPSRRVGMGNRVSGRRQPAVTAPTAAIGETVWGRFVAQARRTPAAVAVRSGEDVVTYEALWAGAEDVAARLCAAGAGPDAIVGVWGARGLGWVRALLGVWGCAAVYLPLDPRWPPARVAAVLRQSGARFVVTDGPPPDVVRMLAEGADWTLVALGAERTAPRGEAETVARSRASDLAYVIYTSGSTGSPKGAMIEHAGLLNHLDAKIDLLALTACDVVAQNASTGFDISLWQCLAPLLVGATVEILDDAVGRDPVALPVAVATRRVTVLELVPSVLRLVLDSANGASEQPFGALRVLLLTGEALSPELCRRWFARHPDISLVNAYGPTECADDVTHHVLRGTPPIGLVRIPIGRPIAGMRVDVLDERLEPVPEGEIGELCVSGVGVARGYLHDPERTAAVFLTRPLAGGTPERLYRTGDRGRRLPDGTFEWLGRLDAQVKIRGTRVEPAEVEAVLGGHPDVRAVTVVARSGAEGALRLVAYMVLAPALAASPRGDGAGSSCDLEQVGEWRRLWDDTYQRELPQASAPSFNTAGWTSRFTRQPLPPVDMREWIDGTVECIRRMAPRRVLEIGCGSGMVLARLAPHCERYVAIDLSSAAVAYVRRHHLAGGALPQVTVVQGAAHEIESLVHERFGVIVLNSVAQYFPSLAYLRGVLASARALLAGPGTIFVGDVRSLPLARTLHVAVELARAPAAATVAQVRARVDRALAQEGELLIDPAFFTALVDSAAPSAVGVQLKRGRVHNELTRFRYDVAWRIGATDEPIETSIDWTADRLTPATWRSVVAAHREVVIAVRGIPNPRLQREWTAARLLATSTADLRVDELRRIMAHTALAPSVDPAEIRAALETGDDDVLIGWSDAGPECYDVVVRPRRREVRGVEGRIERGTSRVVGGSRSGSSLANDPRRRLSTAVCLERLRAHARTRLPEAMVPTTFVVLDALPLTDNGKVDHAALPPPDAGAARDRSGESCASPLERSVAAIWTRVLGVDALGRHDEFFALGGDSLLAYRVLLELRVELGVEVAMDTFLADPTVAGTAGAIENAYAERLASADAEALLEEVEALADDRVAAMLGADATSALDDREGIDA